MMKEEVEALKKEVNDLKDLKEESLALEILRDYKRQTKRLFAVVILILCMWFATGIYLVYVLNDIQVIEETNTEVSQENDNGNNNYIGNDGDITNG